MHRTDLHAGLLTAPQSSLCFILHPLCSLSCTVLICILLTRRAVRNIPTHSFQWSQVIFRGRECFCTFLHTVLCSACISPTIYASLQVNLQEK